MQWWTTVFSIRVSVVCLLAFPVLRRFNTRRLPNTRSVSTDRARLRQWPDWIWLTGAIGSLVHLLGAFAFFHDWSHQAAFQSTAAQTKSLLGVSVGWGLYFNYLFVTLWLADACWMIFSKATYAGRARWLDRIVHGYLLFIAFNGAVVFASGWFRWLSTILFLVSLGFWLTVSGPNPPHPEDQQ